MRDKRRDFIEYFEKLYGRKPTPEDLNGEFLNRVARDMRISGGAAKYNLQQAIRLEIQCTRGADCPCLECDDRRQDEYDAKLMKRLLQLLKTDGFDSDFDSSFPRYLSR